MQTKISENAASAVTAEIEQEVGGWLAWSCCNSRGRGVAAVEPGVVRMDREEAVWTGAAAAAYSLLPTLGISLLLLLSPLHALAVALSAGLASVLLFALGTSLPAVVLALVPLALAVTDPVSELWLPCLVGEEKKTAVCVSWSGVAVVAGAVVAFAAAVRAARRHDVCEWGAWNLARSSVLGRRAAAMAREAVAAVPWCAAAGLAVAAAFGRWHGAVLPGSLAWSAALAVRKSGLLVAAGCWAAHAVRSSSLLSANHVLLAAAAAASQGRPLPPWLVSCLGRPSLRLHVLATPLPAAGAAKREGEGASALAAGRAAVWAGMPWAALLEQMLAEVAAGGTAGLLAARTLSQALLLAPRWDAAGLLVRHDTFPRVLALFLRRHAELRRSRSAATASSPAYLAAERGALLARPGREWRGLARAAAEGVAARLGAGQRRASGSEAALERELRHALHALLAAPELRALAAQAAVPDKEALRSFLEARE